MTLLRLALRSHRIGGIATAAIGALSGLLNSIAYVQIAGATPAERAVFAHSMEVVGRQLSYILPPPVQLDTMGGYLAWRGFSSVAIVYAVWAMLAATGAGRGDEEKGLTEAWLAAGVSRAQCLATRTAAFLIVTIASLVVTGAATAVGAAVSGDPLPLGPLAGELVAVLVLTGWAFGTGLVVAQLVTTRRAASVTAGLVIVALFSLNSLVRAGGDPGPAKWLSPFYVFDRSTPLLAGGAVDWPATAALLAVAAALIGLAIWAFGRRDVGGALLRGRPSAGHAQRWRPASDPLLRIPVLAQVDQQRVWIAGWAIAMAVLAYFLASLARTIVDGFKDIPAMQVYLERAGIGGYADVVGVIWFSTALLLVAIFVVAQVNAWAGDDGEGRLEAVLAAGASRTRIVLERIAALLVAAGIVAAVSSVGVYAASKAFDIPLPTDRLILATALVLPVVFALGAVGHALVGWRPRLAVGLIAAVAVVSYFILELPLFQLPDWVIRTSFFALYGTPMTSVDWAGAATLMAIGVVGTAWALVAMQRRDVGP